ncbi:MAG: hypothetical protein IPJ26_15980 [Bacteroidetes bacterium]|nr:hypothetical protein [Bacteroidota bacterium]
MEKGISIRKGVRKVTVNLSRYEDSNGYLF